MRYYDDVATPLLWFAESQNNAKVIDPVYIIENDRKECIRTVP